MERLNTKVIIINSCLNRKAVQMMSNKPEAYEGYVYRPYPKWIYHPTEVAHIIYEGPVPEGWFESPADCVVETVEEVVVVAPKKTRKKRTPKVK